MIVSSPSPERRTVSAYSRCSSVSSVSSRRPVIPITPGPITTPALTWAAAAGVSLVPSHAYNVASANRSDREIDVANPHGRNHLYGLSVENFRMVFDWYLVGNRALR